MYNLIVNGVFNCLIRGVSEGNDNIFPTNKNKKCMKYLASNVILKHIVVHVYVNPHVSVVYSLQGVARPHFQTPCPHSDLCKYIKAILIDFLTINCIHSPSLYNEAFMLI